jgi:hypothetical protein
MRANGCKFSKEEPWYQTFEDELCRFPRDRHDDQVDAFAYLGLMLDKMINASTPEEEAEEEYEFFKKENNADDGRNKTTGY